MTIEEAIKVLDQKTSRAALMEWMGGTWNQTQALMIHSEAQKIALSALHAPVSQLPNNPLTLSELRELDGEPVWAILNRDKETLGWALVETELEYIAGTKFMLYFEDYGEHGWLAYRRKPEEGIE